MLSESASVARRTAVGMRSGYTPSVLDMPQSRFIIDRSQGRPSGYEEGLRSRDAGPFEPDPVCTGVGSGEAPSILQ